MTSSRTTDERLRYWLNANQSDRERMCSALLGLDRRYSEIRPRRPEGGPDGGRDIEAKRDDLIVWGAVGFFNDVTDSEQQVRDAKRKFESDLGSARAKNPTLKGFAFFTNVDLKPSDQNELTMLGNERGLSFVDLYWRERMRASLDSTDGYGLRLQYLDIPLSDAEQKAFFGRFGADLNDIITKQHKTVEDRLARLEFLHATSRPLREVGFELRLRGWLSKGDLEHFRAVLELQMVSRPTPWWYLAGRDAYHDSGQIGRTSYFWQGKDSAKAHKIGGGIAQSPVASLSFGVGFNVENQRSTPEILDHTAVYLYVTERLASQISEFRVFANGYDLFRANVDKAEIRKCRPHANWPEPLSGAEDAEKLVLVDGAIWAIDLTRTGPKSRW
jgi:hypothetical protein